MLSLDDICPNTRVANGLQQICSQDINKLIRFLQITIMEKIFSVFLRKVKENKLRRSYEINMNYYLYLKDYDPSIDTFLFSMHIFGQ